MRALLAAGLLACSDYRAAPLSIDWGTSEVGAIEMAAWDLDRHVVMSKHIACDVPECRIGDDSWRLTKQALEDGVDGRTWHQAHEIDFTFGLTPERLYLVSKHEFGHALGMEHTSSGFMMRNADEADWTPEVLAECRRVRACA